jgi:acyl transferase domain-containing protein
MCIQLTGNSNGRSEGISYPSPLGQEAVIRQAYKNSGGLDPSLTGYFEAHGTGTQVGDPIEVSAIGRVFAEHRTDDDPLLIGSIKPNLGHSESASAIASIMKVVLALEKREIPPTMGIQNLNPVIDFKGSRTKVVMDSRPWPMMPIRRASVNSFGYGGANCELLLSKFIYGKLLTLIEHTSFSITLTIWYQDTATVHMVLYLYHYHYLRL